MTLQGLRLNLNAKNGIIKTSQTAQPFYEGNYSGSIDVDANKKPPIVKINEKVSQVQLAPLLKAAHSELRLSGLIDASSELKAEGNKAEQLKSSLNGRLNFLIKDSALAGFNLQKIIDEAKALAKSGSPPSDSKSDQTLFSELTGTASLANGIIRNDDLKAKAAKLEISGQGNADLNTDKLAYKLKAKFLDATAPEVGITVAGTFKQPEYKVDVAALVKDDNTKKVVDKLIDHNKDKIDKLLNKLDKKLGPGASNLLKKLF